MSHSNRTCITCAKAKIKCDKNTPSCGRCVRLGIECSAQLRGRGRPPNNAKQPETSNEFSKSKKAYGPSGRISSVSRRIGGDPPSFLLLESLKNELKESSLKLDDKDDRARKDIKLAAISKWMLNVACCVGIESLHDSILDITESLDLEDPVRDSTFEPRPPLSDEEKAMIQIPNHIAAANCAGCGYLVQASSGGSSVFFTNEDMATSFISSAEADEIYASSSCDPDSVMRRLVASRDRKAYLQCMTQLLLGSPELLSEASLICHINSRNGGTPLLCHVTMRACVSPDGEEVVIGVKFAPLPESNYLNRPLEPSAAVSNIPTAPPRVKLDAMEENEQGIDEAMHLEELAQKRKRAEEREAKGKRRTVAPSRLACFEVESAAQCVPSSKKNPRPAQVGSNSGNEPMEATEAMNDFSEVFSFSQARGTTVDSLLDFNMII